MRPSVELRALKFGYNAVRSLRVALRFASQNGDRREMHQICREMIRLLRDTVDLVGDLNANPPEPLIEYEKLRTAFRAHQEALKSMYDDDPDVTDADFKAVTKIAEDGTKALRRRAKNFLKRIKKYFPDLLTTERRLSLERMAGE